VEGDNDKGGRKWKEKGVIFVNSRLNPKTEKWLYFNNHAGVCEKGYGASFLRKS